MISKMIKTVAVDVTAKSVNSADDRIKATRLTFEFIEGTSLTTTLSDKDLQTLADGLKAYLAEKVVALELKRRGM